ncbi:hypothetical protein SAMN04244559_00649 [Magnetospirillum fulvum]|uniref:Lipoprotein n=1 Tax=Magnetospirillum fulvum TaxID=1082 RepID=A0A1H6GXB7_MAGFU|nr:hypothetical protein SAMN04244559_00649 [Magnetospirillum fulvum]
MTRRGLLGLLAVGLGTSLLGGCGRRGKPEEPEGATYPTTYPYTPYPGRKQTPRNSEAGSSPAPETDLTR